MVDGCIPKGRSGVRHARQRAKLEIKLKDPSAGQHGQKDNGQNIENEGRDRESTGQNIGTQIRALKRKQCVIYYLNQ